MRIICWVKSRGGPGITIAVVLGTGVVMGTRGIGGTVTDDITDGDDAVVVTGVVSLVSLRGAGVAATDVEATDVEGRLVTDAVADDVTWE